MKPLIAVLFLMCAPVSAFACGMETHIPDILLSDLMEFVDELPEELARDLAEQVGLEFQSSPAASIDAVADPQIELKELQEEM
jgi:hypothetical protein